MDSHMPLFIFLTACVVSGIWWHHSTSKNIKTTDTGGRNMTAWRDAAIRNSLADEISELFQHRFARGRWSYAEMVYWHNLFAKVLPELSPQDPPDVKKEIRNRLLTVYKDDRDKVKKLYENYDSVFRTHFPDFCSQSIIHSDLHPSVVAFRKRQSRG